MHSSDKNYSTIKSSKEKKKKNSEKVITTFVLTVSSVCYRNTFCHAAFNLANKVTAKETLIFSIFI